MNRLVIFAWYIKKGLCKLPLIWLYLCSVKCDELWSVAFQKEIVRVFALSSIQAFISCSNQPTADKPILIGLGNESS